MEEEVSVQEDRKRLIDGEVSVQEDTEIKFIVTEE